MAEVGGIYVGRWATVSPYLDARIREAVFEQGRQFAAAAKSNWLSMFKSLTGKSFDSIKDFPLDNQYGYAYRVRSTRDSVRHWQYGYGPVDFDVRGYARKIPGQTQSVTSKGANRRLRKGKASAGYATVRPFHRSIRDHHQRDWLASALEAKSSGIRAALESAVHP